MSIFLGQYEYVIDDKGRVNVPSKFRDALPQSDKQLAILKGSGGCLVMYPFAKVDGEESELRSSGLSAMPNPTQGSTTIQYILATSQEVSLDVFSASGRHVVSLMDATTQNAGAHSVGWDGLDESGQPVVPGVYFSRLRVGLETRSSRIVLTR